MLPDADHDLAIERAHQLVADLKATLIRAEQLLAAIDRPTGRAPVAARLADAYENAR